MSEELFKQATTRAEFDELVATAGGRPIFVDFFAEWCGKCELLKPEIEAIAAQHKDDAVYIKIDVEQNEEVAEEYQVESLPTVALLKGKDKVSEMKGSKPENFKKFMEEGYSKWSGILICGESKYRNEVKSLIK